MIRTFVIQKGKAKITDFGYAKYQVYKNIPEGIMLLMEKERKNTRYSTPPSYHDLYSSCWDGNPKKRPNIKDVYNKLKDILPNNNKIEHHLRTGI